MTTSKVMLIAGVALGVLSLIILIAALSNREPDVEAVPAEIRSAPVAPSQSPAAELEPEPEEREPGLQLELDESESLPAGRAPVRTADDRLAGAEAPEAPITFCFPDIVPGPSDCASREEVLSLSGKVVGLKGESGSAEALTVEMVHPDDASTPTKSVSSCREYLRLKSRGWGALTSAGMAASLKLNQFCGLIVMAERAEHATEAGGLTSLTAEALRSIGPGGWPSIGEAVLENPVIRRDEDDARVWRAEGEAMTVILREVAAADFDEDSRSEVLVHSAIAAQGGTARAGGYMLAEREGEELVLTPASIF